MSKSHIAPCEQTPMLQTVSQTFNKRGKRTECPTRRDGSGVSSILFQLPFKGRGGARGLLNRGYTVTVFGGGLGPSRGLRGGASSRDIMKLCSVPVPIVKVWEARGTIKRVKEQEQAEGHLFMQKTGHKTWSTRRPNPGDR